MFESTFLKIEHNLKVYKIYRSSSDTQGNQGKIFLVSIWLQLLLKIS